MADACNHDVHKVICSRTFRLSQYARRQHVSAWSRDLPSSGLVSAETSARLPCPGNLLALRLACHGREMGWANGLTDR